MNSPPAANHLPIDELSRRIDSAASLQVENNTFDADAALEQVRKDLKAIAQDEPGKLSGPIKREPEGILYAKPNIPRFDDATDPASTTAHEDQYRTFDPQPAPDLSCMKVPEPGAGRRYSGDQEPAGPAEKYAVREADDSLSPLDRLNASTKALYETKRRELIALESQHTIERAKLQDHFRVRLLELEHEARQTVRDLDETFHKEHRRLVEFVERLEYMRD